MSGRDQRCNVGSLRTVIDETDYCAKLRINALLQILDGVLSLED